MEEAINTETAPLDATSEMEFHEAFDRVRERIEAVPEHDLEPINLDVPSAVTTILGAELEVRPLRTELARLPGFDMRNVDQLREYAKALGYVHTRYRGAAEASDDITDMVEEMIDTRALFHSDAAALVRRQLLDAKRVDAYRGGNSHKMIAFDVIGLADLFLDRWDIIAARSALTREELEQARSQANRLVAAVGQREQAPAVRTETTVTRAKAYTLLIRAYNETRQAVAFVRRRQGDVDDITPSLFAGRGKRSPEPPIVVPEPTPPASIEPDAPATERATAADAPVGFPGANPLV